MNQHFVAAYQQVGDFKAVKTDATVTKNGGNVASHFLTPDGRVLHSVPGPVPAATLLDEARWAIELHQRVATTPRSNRGRLVSLAHQQAGWAPSSSRDRQVHQLFANQPLPMLKTVYEQIFTGILGERISRAAPRLNEAARRLTFAKRSSRPILFVMHGGEHWNRPAFTADVHQVLNQFVVIAMPLREAPALSQLTGQPPFEGNARAGTLLVVADSDCKQLASVDGWNQQALKRTLARGWIDALERRPPGIRSLVRAQRLLRGLDPDSADRAKRLTIRVLKETRAARDEENEKSRKSLAASELERAPRGDHNRG